MRPDAALVHMLEELAANAYLQVMLNNTTAINLYTKLGLRYLYGYHYRVAQSDPKGRKTKRGAERNR